MVVIDAIDLIVYIHSKWNTIQALIAYAAAEAAGMVWFTHSLEYLELLSSIIIIITKVQHVEHISGIKIKKPVIPRMLCRMIDFKNE